MHGLKLDTCMIKLVIQPVLSVLTWLCLDFRPVLYKCQHEECWSLDPLPIWAFRQDSDQMNEIFELKIVNIFLPVRFNICFGCSKELSQWDSSFEYIQHMFWLRDKKVWYTLLTKGLCGTIDKSQLVIPKLLLEILVQWDTGFNP